MWGCVFFLLGVGDETKKSLIRKNKTRLLKEKLFGPPEKAEQIAENLTSGSKQYALMLDCIIIIYGVWFTKLRAKSSIYLHPIG